MIFRARPTARAVRYELFTALDLAGEPPHHPSAFDRLLKTVLAERPRTFLVDAAQWPNATPTQVEFARHWRDMSKPVFSSTIDKVGWNIRLVTGDAVAEIPRLKAEDRGPMGIGGATLARAAMRSALIDEYVLATAPVLMGGGTPFFTALDSWVNLKVVETRTLPCGVILTRYETRR
ncbi:dihydrofolate reductase family protein [Streptomyces sp. Ru72]|uniref:dihydrofolate reductase family protein n=1 Tax=Streptomyces sp. Ru72 TaxID=2080747 RepID=UPI0021560114|nr:dihydrofolate reductase family protein [Streptomyces sp. Ru72]